VRQRPLLSAGLAVFLAVIEPKMRDRQGCLRGWTRPLSNCAIRW
jgi:hypothetical protein